MGILQSPVTLLIVGILSFAIVHGQRRNSDQLIEKIKELAEQNQLIEPGTFDQNRRKFEDIARATCDSNGGPSAYYNAEIGLEKFGNCVVSVFSTEMRIDPGMEVFDAMINHYCPKVQPLDACVEQFLNSINPCLDAEKRKIADVLTSSAISLLEYACENGGEHVKTFINDNGAECLPAYQASLPKCAEYLREVDEDKNLNNTSTKQPSFGPSVAECKNFEEFQHCAVNEFKKCNKPSITEIGKSLLHILFEKSGCKKLLGSNASPTTAINFLLIIATTAMLL